MISMPGHELRSNSSLSRINTGLKWDASGLVRQKQILFSQVRGNSSQVRIQPGVPFIPKLLASVCFSRGRGCRTYRWSYRWHGGWEFNSGGAITERDDY